MLSLPIDYLTTLNYPDIINLSITCKEYGLIRQNETLKNIIGHRTKAILPVGINISRIFEELDNSIVDLINFHYSHLPKWVDQEMFMKHFKSQVYYNFLDSLAMLLSGYRIYDKFDDGLIENDGTIVLNLAKESIAFALTSLEYRGYNYDEEIPIDVAITLSKELTDYIIFVLNNNIDYNYHNLFKLLSGLLLN